jgi:replicative DNA helicase
MSTNENPFAHMLSYDELYGNDETEEDWDDPDIEHNAPYAPRLLRADEESSWTYPVALPGEVTRAPYPVGALPDVLRDTAEAAAAQVDAPVDLGACVALGCLSAAVVGAVEAGVVAVESGGRGWREPAALYVCCVAQSGEGKTPLVTFLRAPLEDVQRERQAAAGPAIAAAVAKLEVLRGQRDAAKRAASKGTISSADLASLTEDVARAEAEQPGELRLLAYDITPEKLADLAGANAGRLGVISDEGAELLELTGRYQSKTPNYGPLIAGRDGNTWTSDRIGRPSAHVDHLTLTVALMIQPIAVRRLLAADENARDRGLAARFLFSWPESRIGYTTTDVRPVPVSVQRSWAKLVHDLAGQAHTTKEAIVLSLSIEAADEFRSWSMKHELRDRKWAI